jgi:N-formylglutamate deformylase
MPVGPYRIVMPAGRRVPVIAHVPHASTVLPSYVRDQIVLEDAELEREVARLTDWHVDDLFSWVPQLGGCMFVNALSRLVFDPERFADDDSEPMASVGQGAVYDRTTDGGPLAVISAAERSLRMRELYEPYHEGLTALVASTVGEFGGAIILDCHSFASTPLPHEMDQSPSRPDICVGTDPFHTPHSLSSGLVTAFEAQGFSAKLDSPFAGTLVPLDFLGRDSRVKSVMVEVRRGLYCDEASGERSDRYGATRAAVEEAVSSAVASVFAEL